MRKRENIHARQRLAERAAGEVSIDMLNNIIRLRLHEPLRRQSHTRTICRAMVDGSPVYFVLNKVTGDIVTVLTEEQARSQLQSYGLVV